jgi:phenylalanyl-tRNA synthetase beta chain
MRFTFNWLKEFATFSGAPELLAELLTMAGLEVESFTPLREPNTDKQDWLFEVGVTPNRGDCLGIAGIAREVAALAGETLRSPASSAAKKDAAIHKRISLKIEDPQLCPRYSARIVDEVRVAPAPALMRFRLEACGIRAINNVVDVTNYVMLETGQPLHAFDLDRLEAKKIIVRAAGDNKKFTTLDGVERDLFGGDVLICDGDTPVALAGVMGGMDSEVRETTRSMLLESANFAPAAIRRTAKRLALHSEASHRFERGVDPEGTIAALNRAVHLLGEIAGGQPLAGAADLYARKEKAPVIVLREERIAKLLGLKIDLKRAEKLLKPIGMKTQTQGKSRSLKVVPPTTRPDISREADLIEELARLHGYNNIPTTLPLVRLSGGKIDYRLSWERKARAFFAGEGLSEVINLPFTTTSLNASFVGLWQGPPAPVPVLNPLAKDNAEMRHSLLPGLIENLRLNMAQQARSFTAYHFGKVFRLTPHGASEEKQSLAGLLYGPRARRGLRLGAETPQGFLECKGLVEGLLDLLYLRELVGWSTDATGVLHPGRSAVLRCNDEKIGYLGQLHPDLCDPLELPPVLLFELDFEILLEYAPRQITVHALPRFPAVERDVAIVVDRDFAAQQIIDYFKNLGNALIEHVEVFDEYSGVPIPEGKKSLAFKVSYRAEDRTLTDSEINELHQALVLGVRATFGAERRS